LIGFSNVRLPTLDRNPAGKHRGREKDSNKGVFSKHKSILKSLGGVMNRVENRFCRSAISPQCGGRVTIVDFLLCYAESLGTIVT
jgi:hypothetical protein